VGDLKKRYKVKKENIKKLKLFLQKINRKEKNGKQHKLGRDLLR